MKTAVLTGGTGFLGYWLLRELVQNDVFVYVIVRKNSKRVNRLKGLKGIKIIELELSDILQLPMYIQEIDVFYHLAWEGGRNNFDEQMKNIEPTVLAMQAASQIGVKQFIVTGSQAEYGICEETINELTKTKPNTAYGACKLACYEILKVLAAQVGISLTWVRVFSVYGEGDNENTLISYLFKTLMNNQVPQLTDCNQTWDFLYAEDAARALRLLGELEYKGIYNLASGDYKELKEFVIKTRDIIAPNMALNFGAIDTAVKVQLIADISKINKETNWKPNTSFEEGIKKIKNNI